MDVSSYLCIIIDTCIGIIGLLTLLSTSKGMIQQPIRISRIYVYNFWLPGGPEGDASALHSKAPVEPYLLSLPPIHLAASYIRAPRCLIDRKTWNFEKRRSAGVVGCRGSLTHVETRCRVSKNFEQVVVPMVLSLLAERNCLSKELCTENLESQSMSWKLLS